MRTAKSSKIVLLLIAMALSLIAFFVCFSGAQSVFGATPDNPEDYFLSTSTVEYKNDGVSTLVEKDGSLSINSDLALDNLGFEIKLDSSVKAFAVEFVTLPYFVNGNVKEVDGEKQLVDILRHKLVVSIDGTALAINFNNESASATLDGNFDLAFKVIDNVLYAYVEGVEIYSNNSEYKVRDIDTCIAEDVKFVISELNGSATQAEILLLSVDQNTADTSGKYKQTFKLNSDGKIEKKATPYAVVADKFISADGKIYLKSMFKNTLAMRGLSVLGEIKSANLSLAKVDANDQDIWLGKDENTKSVLFNGVGVKSINIETNLSDYTDNKVLRTLEVNIYDEDTVAPTYEVSLVGSEAYEAYKLAVEKAAKTVDGDGEEKHIKLGDSYIIPSLEGFVKDDMCSFENLNATVYYKTPLEEKKTSSSLEISVESAGEYVFYVAFGDQEGNAMEEDDFFTVDEDDENIIIDGMYRAFVFSFHIEDDSAFEIDASRILGKGYVGKKYTATDFKINASNFSKNYKLFYNAKADAKASDEGWVEIIKASNLTDDYSNEVFSSEEIKAIDYNGALSFTPDRVGSYKITCSIVSDVTSRAAEAEAVFVVEKATTVKPYKPLETREVFAIVFLSVGGLCLIGIVALIFVKPKEETDAKD